MSRVNYNNFLRDKLRNSFKVNKMYVNPSQNLSYTNHNFKYTIKPEYAPIVEQGWNFADAIVATGTLYGVKTFYGKAFDEAKQIIANAYVYSYMKAVWYGCAFVEQRPGGFRTPQASTLFYGHKFLYDCLVEGTIYTTDSAESYQLSIGIDVDQKVMADIISFPNITTNRNEKDIEAVYYDEKRGTIYSALLESVLTQLLSNVGTVEMENMNSSTLPEAHSFGLNPLGNSCYTADGKKIIYIDSAESFSNKVSSFWGIANLIRLVEEVKIDSNDSLYCDFDVSEYYPSNISFEVESITGFNPLNIAKEDHKNWKPEGFEDPKQ